MLLDSNIIIYAALPEARELRAELASSVSSASVISLVEVLGYHSLTPEKKRVIEAVFAQAEVLPVTDQVIEHAIALRQRQNIKLGDSLIAGTALAHGLTLMTRNTRDFSRIEGLHLYNPFERS